MTKEECEIETSKAIMEMRNHIAELEKEISILLSCNNCPENKGGYICQKEYEDKCLAQKIQFIKELQEENAELKEEVKNNEDLATVAYMRGAESQKKKADKQLAKAKEIIKKFSEFVNNEVEYDPEHPQEHTDLWNELCGQAEQFLQD